MKRSFEVLVVALCVVALAGAAAKPKVIGFGAWTPVKWFVGPEEGTALELKVRALVINGTPRNSPPENHTM
jgi:hypothetical protein